jgi:3-oxoacyl-[acyl-carrier protein] reductase
MRRVAAGVDQLVGQGDSSWNFEPRFSAFLKPRLRANALNLGREMRVLRSNARNRTQTRRSSVLEGQVALVTGGGQGIGKAIAIRFAQQGADIAVVDLKRETAEATAREVVDIGRRATVRVADVSDYQAINVAINEIVAELGRLDVLVNNAGIEKRAPFLEITPEDWQRQIQVNLSGTFFCTQAAAREMAKRGYGRIVNLSSVAGLIGPIDLAAYGASKAGVIGLTRAAALDLADHGITVNAIAPGPIETELMLGAWTAEALRERPQHGAIPRFGTVEEIANTALFLASPDSGFITGITVSVDGGAVSSGAYMVEKYRRRKAAQASEPQPSK